MGAYNGILENFTHNNDDGTIDLTSVCAVAELDGNPHCDETYEYYINEPIKSNNTNGAGAFILANLEINLYFKTN